MGYILRFCLLIAGFVAACCARTAQASPLTDFYIKQALGRYFELPVDARTLSMGGASALGCHGSVCIFQNPAGLGSLTQIELSSSLGVSNLGGEGLIDNDNLEETNYHGYIVGAFPIGPFVNGRPKFGVVDFGYSRYDGHTDDSIRTTPDGHRRSIAYGYSPLDSLSLGYSFNFYDDQLHTELSDLHSHSRLLHTWGIQIRPEPDIELAGIFRLGIGQSDTEDFRFDSDGLSHLRSYSGSVAISKILFETKVALAFDYTRVRSRGNLDQVAIPVTIGGSEEGNVYNIRLGFERPIIAPLVMRAGFRLHEVESYRFHRPDLENLSGTVKGLGLAVGIGYEFRDTAESKLLASLDYGFDYLSIGRGAYEHVLTVTLPLNL